MENVGADFGRDRLQKGYMSFYLDWVSLDFVFLELVFFDLVHG